MAQVNNDCHRRCWPGWCRWKRCYCWLKTEALKEEEKACFEAVREKEDYESIFEGKNLKHRDIRGNSNSSTIVKIGIYEKCCADEEDVEFEAGDQS